jgi:hypothetical protein
MIPIIFIYEALIHMLIVLCETTESSVAHNREKNRDNKKFLKS